MNVRMRTQLQKGTAWLLAAVLLLCGPFALAAARGDVDQSGSIEAADARLALRQAVGLEQYAPGSAEFTACDADLSGVVDASDARLILRAAVGLETLASTEELIRVTGEYALNVYGDACDYVILRNDSAETVALTAEGEAFAADGGTLGTATFAVPVLAPGEETVACFYFSGAEDIARVEYELTCGEAAFAPCLADLRFSTEAQAGQLAVQVTNEGERTARYVQAYALFFDDAGALIFVSSGFAADAAYAIKPGRSARAVLDAPDTYARVSVYLTGRAAAASEQPADALDPAEFETEGFGYQSGDTTVYFFAVQNNADVSAAVTADCTALDVDGKALGTGRWSVPAIAPGETLFACCYFDNVPLEQIADVGCELGAVAAENAVSAASLISVSCYENKTNVTVAAKNTGTRTAAAPEAYIVFFNSDGTVRAYSVQSLTDIDNELKPGGSVAVQAPAPEGYARVQVFIAGAAAAETNERPADRVDTALIDRREAVLAGYKETRYFVILTNNADVPVRLQANAVARTADGGAAGAARFTVDVLGPGETTVGCLYFPGVEQSRISRVDQTIEAAEAKTYRPLLSGLQTEQKEQKNGVNVTVTNSGTAAAKYVQVHALFYNKNGLLTAYDSAYLTAGAAPLLPGQSAAAQLSAGQAYDRVELYLSGRGE